jgi:CRISPR-associated protein Csx17
MRAAECRELRVAVGLASCRTEGIASVARSMRQILLPVDPGAPKPLWRETPLIAGFGLRPLRAVLADVLSWRARTAAGEQSDNQQHRVVGVPTFRWGVPVPDADAHAFATPGRLDEELLDLWLRACLALSWRGVQHAWDAAPPPAHPVPLLGILHPFAAGLAPSDGGLDAPRLGMEPDWPARLTAGQLGGVHNDAARRLRQAGWRAAGAPGYLSAADHAGIYVAAALVPRCLTPRRVLCRHLATPLVAADDPTTTTSEREMS